MESAAANIHDHHKSPLQQHQIVLCSSSSSSSPLHNHDYVAASHGSLWSTPNTILSNVSFGSSATDAALVNLRNPPRLQNDNNILVSSLLNPCMMTKEFGLEWDGNGINSMIPSNGHELSQIKEESLLYPACYSNNNYAKELREVDELNVKLLRSNGNGIHQSSLEECSSFSSPAAAVTSRKHSSSSQIYPTINVSELLGQNVSMGNNSGGFGLNFQALDLFNNNSARFGASFRSASAPFQDHLGYYKNSSCFPYGLDFMQQSIDQCTLDSGGNYEELHNKRVEELKKHDVNSEPKAGKTQVGSKRSRLESRACPPFKVRKEKLGDRIAALQQLVAPFGKTDTASVLMEAIGYIKFLQNQVETLSVPYLKSSRHKNNRAAVPHGGYVDNRSEERKQDLRSRGLCLVPVSCLSYVTEGGGAMWPPPPFG